MRSAWVLVVILQAALLTSCVGRLVTAEGEAELGSELATKVGDTMGVVEDEPLASYVSAVGARIATASPEVRGGFAYHFQVVDTPEPNAFALPGGYVFVSRGLLALLASEDELANVLAHEVAHVSSRHHLQHAVRRTPFVPVDLAAGIGGFAAGILSPTLGKAVSSLGRAPGSLVLASYSRGQEDSADSLGQEFAAAAGWDPAAMSSVMDALTRDQAQRGGDPERRDYFSTHPTSPDRSRRTAAHASTLTTAETLPIADGTAAFFANLEGMTVGLPARTGAIAGSEFLHPELDFRIAFPSGWKVVDTPAAVRAHAENEDAVATLGIVAEGDDPLARAEQWLKETRLEALEGPEPVRVGGLPAATLVTRFGRGQDESSYVMTWIAHGGRIYRVNAGSYQHAWEARRPALEAVATSFRPLRASDAPRIREGRLRVVRAKAGSVLEELMPADSAWTLDETAMANDLRPDTVLRAGALVKVAPLEPYRASAE